jgi:hypothetical protein
VKTIVTECARLREEADGPDFPDALLFSIENWKRPVAEVAFLMQMYIDYLRAERATMMEKNIRFQQIGDSTTCPTGAGRSEPHARADEEQHGLNLVLALNYGSRAEITDAVTRIAEKVRAGELDPADVTEQTISDHLYTAGCPTRTCSSVPPARCGSATTCCGRSATPSCSSATSCGRVRRERVARSDRRIWQAQPSVRRARSNEHAAEGEALMTKNR